MKLLTLILMSILAYATGEVEYLKFSLYSIYNAREPELIAIEKNGDEAITEVNVLQEIAGDDLTLEYSVTIDFNYSPSTVIKFCETAETMQDVNIIELFMKTLGLENQGCPIQPQTITNPEPSFEGYLEVGNYNEGQWIQVEMLLMKGDQPVLVMSLAT